MPWPSPAFVLYVLGAFVVGYGLSLSIRASRGRRWKGLREACPECASAWPAADAPACGRCGARPPAPSAIRWAVPWTVGGVLVSIAGIGVFVLGQMVAAQMHGEFGGRGPAVTIGPFLGGGFGVSFFGLYVAIVGYRGQRARGRRRCPRCWYLIDAALGRKCSECGHEAGREKDLFRPRRRWKLAALGLLLVALGQFGWMESRVRRGGWLAAVPTEVLIVGMPWLPDYCLEDGLGGEYEDWSLAGRFHAWWNVSRERRVSDRVWTWHRPWAQGRAAGLLRGAGTTAEVMHAARVLDSIESADRGREPLQVDAATVLHAVRIGVEALSDPTDVEVGPVLLWTFWRARVREDPTDPFAEDARLIEGFPELVSELRAEIIPHVVGSANDRTIGSAILLGLGQGEPETVDALLECIHTNPRAAFALSTLADRHPHVFDALLAMARDPADRRRGRALTGLARLARPGTNEEDDARAGAILGIARERLTDATPVVMLAAAEVLWWSLALEARLDAFDAMLRAVRGNPRLADRALQHFGDANTEALQHHELRLAELAGSDDPALRRFFLDMVLASPADSSPLVLAEALRLIESGEQTLYPLDGWQLESARARVDRWQSRLERPR